MNFATPNSAAVYLLLVGLGAAVSFINAVSGGGSILSLPVLLFLGLPAAEANGTNRLGIWMGALGSMAAFRRKGMIYPRLAWRAGFPGLLGAVAGSLAGVSLPDVLFRPVLAGVIIFVLAGTLRHRRNFKGNPDAPESRPYLSSGPLPFLAYAGIGFYGGFIQAGVGLVMMFAFSRLGRMNLIQVNSLKVSNTFLFLTLSLAVYGVFGKVKWDLALAMALGNLLGGFAGAVFQVRRGEGFVRVFLAVTGTAFALKLAYDAVRAWF